MNTTISLKLFSFGIQKLHDPNWTGMDLYDKIKQHVRQRTEPKNLLFKTLKDGLLYYLGNWIYEEYLIHLEGNEEYIELEGDYLLWYLEDYLAFLIDSGVDENDDLIKVSFEELENFNNLFVEDESKYYELLFEKSEALKTSIINLSIQYELQIESMKSIYSQDFAERVFHDRTLCEYISELLITIGFDGTISEDDLPQKWINRYNIPSWAKKAIISRDRGKCAQCDKNLVIELESNYHFDHIVPLHYGGTNDLSNLQLLCEKCNLEKSTSKVSVKTSVPKYLQIKK